MKRIFKTMEVDCLVLLPTEELITKCYTVEPIKRPKAILSRCKAQETIGEVIKIKGFREIKREYEFDWEEFCKIATSIDAAVTETNSNEI